MNVVRGTEHWPPATDRDPGPAGGSGQHGRPGWTGPVVTIGNFDGVHLGHRALIDATRARAAALGAPAVVVTFDPAPRDVLRPDNGIPRIQSLDRKRAHLEAAGLDAMVIQPFDRALAAMTPEAFAARHLGEHLGVRALVVGHDFRFGRARAGSAATLREVLGVPVEEVEARAIAGDDAPVSSSRIREALTAGDVAGAARLLGHPHELVGTVIHGDQRGRTIGFPTANLVPEGGLVPPHGVYAVRAEVDGAWRGGVANLGSRPTFDGRTVRLEVHLFDFAGDLYGRTLVVGLVDRLRGEQKFDGIDALVAQIRADAEAARRIVG
ncbi:MAG: bifunctional riboflavin kinase/FAD synthetase [Myxococcota bacterium]